MKRIFLMLFVAGLAIGMWSCKKGDQGDPGFTGTTGDKGKTGDTGALGAPYKPYASGWIVLDSSTWTYDANADSSNFRNTYTDKNTGLQNCNDTTIKFHNVLSLSKLTQKVLDSGKVYFYLKDSTDPTVPIWNISPGNLLPVGTTTVPSTKMPLPYVISLPAAKAGSMDVTTRWFGEAYLTNTNSVNYDPKQPNHNKLPPRTKCYIRYVVVTAVNERTTAAVDFKKYNDVKKYFGFND